MDDLVRWLREQLKEDERVARAATPGPVIGDVDRTLDSIDRAVWDFEDTPDAMRWSPEPESPGWWVGVDHAADSVDLELERVDGDGIFMVHRAISVFWRDDQLAVRDLIRITGI
jgi:hypothetical protein